jgi:hypothetical protein
LNGGGGHWHRAVWTTKNTKRTKSTNKGLCLARFLFSTIERALRAHKVVSLARPSAGAFAFFVLFVFFVFKNKPLDRAAVGSERGALFAWISG